MGKKATKKEKRHSYMQLGQKKRKVLAFISVMKNIKVESDHGILQENIMEIASISCSNLLSP
jgi:hypothetical protein